MTEMTVSTKCAALDSVMTKLDEQAMMRDPIKALEKSRMIIYVYSFQGYPQARDIGLLAVPDNVVAF